MGYTEIGCALSVALVGLTGSIVEVESHLSMGLPGFSIVGLPDTSVNEARDRVRAAISSSNLPFPHGKVVVNLSPASIPKQGSVFDLSIALSVVAAKGIIDLDGAKNTVFLAELGLDGRLHPVRGVLPSIIAAKSLGIKKVYVAIADEPEGKCVPGIDVEGITHLTELVKRFADKQSETARLIDIPDIKAVEKEKPLSDIESTDNADMCDVVGHTQARKALEIAAAGGHHLLMVGPPGTGKTMLASRLPTILPDLKIEESLEVTSIHSISGTLQSGGLIKRAPFESPHHTATPPSIIGGGSKIAKPGAISRAHRGVLFLDEAPEFSPYVLQTLRQPLESGEIVINRVSGEAKYPAQFQLIMAANPCPCGMYYGDGSKCSCSSLIRRRYFSRLSGPLLDRMDMQVQVEQIKSRELRALRSSSYGSAGAGNGGSAGAGNGGAVLSENESSESIKKRVIEARKLQEERLSGTPWKVNARVPGSYLRSKLGSNSSVIKELMNAYDKGFVSMRGMDRAIRVAWTLADLEGRMSPDVNDISLAILMRPRM
jgi:magnesium chelatase family protein